MGGDMKESILLYTCTYVVFTMNGKSSGNQPTFWEGTVLSCLRIILIKLPYLVYRWDRKVWQKKAVSCAIPCSYFVCVCPLQAGESVWYWKSPAPILALVWKEGWAPAQETNHSLYKKYSVVRPLFLIFIFNHIQHNYSLMWIMWESLGKEKC